LTKLNQLIAIEKGVKNTALRELTDAHREVQKQPLLSGLSRTYQPRDDEGDPLPPESTRVQLKAEEVLSNVASTLTRLFDVILTKDTANTKAQANVVVDGKTILSDVPVSYLLFLEKELTLLHTFIQKLPTLDPAESWKKDATSGTYATEPVQTTRTKKIPRNHVKARATDKHAEQVEVYHEDVIVGHWTITKFSGALPQSRIEQLAQRVQALQDAVKFAREEANTLQVTDRKAGKPIFDYLFAE
jgi:hypothetical protein